VDTRAVLRDAGLLVEDDVPGADDRRAVDWSRTRAYVQNHLFVNVNLRGREAQGIVAPQAYDRTCDEIVAALHAYIDPGTGLHPYNLALRKVDARYLGLYGDPSATKVGDVVFTVREPFGGNHGSQLSTAAWGLGSNASICLLRGPGIRRGVTLERNVWLTDVTPTICHLLGVPVPRDAEGAILYQALE
jgi:predicted AlkP superfamily phosphohydrolase/phosphomutase